MWWRQAWIEHNPLRNSETILGLNKSISAPMSAMSPNAWQQQPCNAFSNAAFFEVALHACRTSLSDYKKTWAWKDEIITAAALMAFGSFAMHGNPSSGMYHEATGSTDPDASSQMAYDTAMFDRVSMDVIFFTLFQSIVRAWASDPRDAVALKPILGLVQDPSLAPLGCDMMYCDSRLMVRQFQRVLTGPTSNWKQIHDFRSRAAWLVIIVISIIDLLILLFPNAWRSPLVFKGGSEGWTAFAARCRARLRVFTIVLVVLLGFTDKVSACTCPLAVSRVMSCRVMPWHVTSCLLVSCLGTGCLFMSPLVASPCAASCHFLVSVLVVCGPCFLSYIIYPHVMMCPVRSS